MAAPLINSPEAFADAFRVSRETVERLRLYEELLRRWQKAINLVAPSTLEQIWHRHFADSAQLLDFAPEMAGRTDAPVWLDLGSGAGFPGMVIAILLANHASARIHLVESHARKCAFLAEVARETGTPVEIHQTRIESLSAADRVIRPALVSARALAPLERLLELAAPFMGEETRGLFLKGREAEEEIRRAGRRFSFHHRLHPSRTDATGRIVEIDSLRPRPRRNED